MDDALGKGHVLVGVHTDEFPDGVDVDVQQVFNDHHAQQISKA